jgi:hypothetical protein
MTFIVFGSTQEIVQAYLKQFSSIAKLVVNVTINRIGINIFFIGF